MHSCWEAYDCHKLCLQVSDVPDRHSEWHLLPHNLKSKNAS
jgi:hypothetical protein